MTAYACAVAGMRPVLLDADRIGAGHTGRSAGLLLPDPGPSFRSIVSAYGLRAGRKMFDSWRRAALDGAATIRRLGIRAALEPFDTLTIDAGVDERALRREAEARADAGLDARWLNTKQVRQLARVDATGAMRVGDAFSVDPFRVCLGVAAAAKQRGAVFFERTAVRKVRAGRKQVDLSIDGGVIRVQSVVIATSTATPEFTQLRRHFKRRSVYLAITEPVPAAIRKQIAPKDLSVRDTASSPHRVSWTRDDRLLVCGGDQDEVPARSREAALVQRTGELMYELLKKYPAISGLMPEYGWDLTYGDTSDGLPYIGAHRNFPRHLFALGGGRDSLTGAFLAARILARAIAGAPEKGDDLFGFTR
jgi:glycine/D-amino acid oxidase-like deaminating enzyme